MSFSTQGYFSDNSDCGNTQKRDVNSARIRSSIATLMNHDRYNGQKMKQISLTTLNWHGLLINCLCKDHLTPCRDLCCHCDPIELFNEQLDDSIIDTGSFCLL